MKLSIPRKNILLCYFQYAQVVLQKMISFKLLHKNLSFMANGIKRYLILLLVKMKITWTTLQNTKIKAITKIILNYQRMNSINYNIRNRKVVKIWKWRISLAISNKVWYHLIVINHLTRNITYYVRRLGFSWRIIY